MRYQAKYNLFAACFSGAICLFGITFAHPTELNIFLTGVNGALAAFNLLLYWVNK